jgi:CheY-like chemotaxis protein
MTSFITAFEYFETVMIEMLSLLDKTTVKNNSEKSNQPDISPVMKTRIVDMQSCLESLRSTYEVSLTIINRCSDFYRTAVGASLLPTKELVNVNQVVIDSIKCMQAIVLTRSKIHLQWNIANPENTTRLQEYAMNNYTAIDKQLNEKNLCMLTDEKWLRENLLCLISNAVKFSNEGDVVVSVDYMIEEVGSTKQVSTIGKAPMKYVRFGVVDKGMVLSDEEFSHFFQLDSDSTVRFTGGIGLGLVTLAKRLDALEGKYGANRRNDGLCGTEVWFAIPHKSYSIETTPVTPIHPPLPSIDTASTINDNFMSTQMISTTTIGRGIGKEAKHILIVDDSVAIMKMLSMMFKKLGYTVSTAMHGKAAVDIITDAFAIQQTNSDEETRIKPKEKSNIDIILMDIQMPVMNGFEAMKHIRHLEQLKQYTQSVTLDYHSISKSISDDPEQHLDGIRQRNRNRNSICIIAMSANSEFSTYQDAVNAGADAFLNKRFTMELFERTLERCQRKVYSL